MDTIELPITGPEWRASVNQHECETLLVVAAEIGNLKLSRSEISYSETSRLNEQTVLTLLKEAAVEVCLDAESIKLHGGHAFPDITIDGTSIGIELKGTKTGRAFIGNSVIASTMLPSLTKIYVFYWIDDEKQMGFRDYFECVTGAQVTHSPRFVLDIDISESECIFGNSKEKVGTIDKICFGPEGIDHKEIIDWMRARAISTGQVAWWIGTENNQSPGELNNSFSILGRYTDLSEESRNSVLKTAFLCFPGVLKRGTRMYDGVLMWGLSTRNVLLYRDAFSAGGRKPVNLSKLSPNGILLPAVVTKAIEYFKTDAIVRLDEVEKILDRSFKDISELRSYLREYIIENKLIADMYQEAQLQVPSAKFTESEFVAELASLIVDSINPDKIFKSKV